MTRRLFALIAACALALLVCQPAKTSSAATNETLEVASKTGVHAFAVEVVTTPEEHQKGLMFRKEVPEGTGMLFDFGVEQPLAFWMKNTYVSLDIIFIRADGRILSIAEHTEPMSERQIPSNGPAK